MRISSVLRKNQIIIAVLPNAEYSDYLLKITKYSSKKFKSPVYVSLNKIYKSLRKSFEMNKIDPDKFYYIDGITKTLIPNIEDIHNCVFIDSSASLTQLSLALVNVLEKKRVGIVIFDSLSTLLINNDMAKVTRFTQFIVNRIREKNTKAIFTVLNDDSEKGFIRKLGMFVDKIVKF